MGLDCYTYIGPYFSCKLGKNKRDTVSFRDCPNENCEQHGGKRPFDSSAKFCPNCGQAIVVTEKDIEVSSIDAKKVANAVRDSLTRPFGDSAGDWMKTWNVHIWMGNKGGDNIGLNFDPTTEVMIEEMDINFLSREKEEFEKFYSEELRVLQKFYGEDNVRTCWGLINAIY